MSWEEFLEWLPDDVRAEWVDGEVVYLSPVADPHARISGFLYALLEFFVEAHDIGVVRIAPFLMKTGPGLGGREPDILFLSKEHLSRLQYTFVDGPADLVVEIVSPDSVKRDTVQKLAEYEAGGIPEYWLIDPKRRHASFFHLDEAGRYQQVAADADGVFHSPLLPGLWLQESWLWQDTPPRLLDVLKQWGLV